MRAQLALPFDGGLSRLPPKIRSRIDIDENGCWIFEGARSDGGYARIGPTKAHRLIWEILRGPVPTGYVLDHYRLNPGPREVPCSRACGNPDHLEVVLQRVNVLRGRGRAAINARKKACPRGHALANGNLARWHLKRGARACLICCRVQARARARARREGRGAVNLTSKSEGGHRSQRCRPMSPAPEKQVVDGA